MRIEMRGDRGGAVVVKRRDLIAIGRSPVLDFRRHGIEQRQFDRIRPDMIGRDGARPTDIAGFGEMRHHVGLPQRPRRLKSEEFRIARSYSDANQPRGLAHIPALARALTAAAVMALPPMRPRTIKNGIRCSLAYKASLDSAAPTKPTGRPRIAAGLGAPASSNSRSRNNAVGALPIATTASASLSPHNSKAAAERVVSSFSARAGTLGSCSAQNTSLRAGNRARVMPCATISASQRIGAPRAKAARAAATRPWPNRKYFAASTSPQAWIIRIATPASSTGKRERSASARMIANERS